MNPDDWGYEDIWPEPPEDWGEVESLEEQDAREESEHGDV